MQNSVMLQALVYRAGRVSGGRAVVPLWCSPPMLESRNPTYLCDQAPRAYDRQPSLQQLHIHGARRHDHAYRVTSCHLHRGLFR
jgi:hypothetical protein